MPPIGRYFIFKVNPILENPHSLLLLHTLLKDNGQISNDNRGYMCEEAYDAIAQRVRDTPSIG